MLRRLWAWLTGLLRGRAAPGVGEPSILPAPPKPLLRSGLFDMAVARRARGSVLEANQSWRPHAGKTQRRRQMRQRAATIMRSRDPQTVGVLCDLAALADGMPEDPFDEFYPVICETLFTGEDEGRPWAEVAGGVVTMFEDAVPNETAEGVSA